MKANKYHIFPHITVSILLHLIVFIIFIVAIILSAKYYPDSTIIIATVIPALFVIMFLFLNVLFWNSMVTLDLDGMHQRRGVHMYTWRWDEITDVKCRVNRPWPLNTTAAAMYSPKIIFITSAHNKKLSIVMEKYTQKVLFKMCTNEELKVKCLQMLDACNYVYFK